MKILGKLNYLWIAVSCVFLSISNANADAVGNDGAEPTVILQVPPMLSSDSFEAKHLAFNVALFENDFLRVVQLFETCAKRGDPFCQYFLGAGISEWHLRVPPGNDARYDEKYVRYWLLKAYSSDITLPYVTSIWDRYYLFGYMGFPRDEELQNCWGTIGNSSFDLAKDKMRARAVKCKNLEIKKYGRSALWLH